MNTNDRWGFVGDNSSSSSNSIDGVYFYGAPGTLNYEQPVAASNVVEKSAWNRQRHFESPTLIPGQAAHHPNIEAVPARNLIICPYFQAGDCRFGQKCRNYHEPEIQNFQEDHDASLSLKNCIYEKETKKVNCYVECSICISVPDKDKGELFGIMSHCSCIFCLVCIREWRVEGLKVASKSEQVRMCPTCRVNSFFVVPSINFVLGQDKEDLIVRYKQSLAAKPCKVSSILLVSEKNDQHFLFHVLTEVLSSFSTKYHHCSTFKKAARAHLDPHVFINIFGQTERFKKKAALI